MAVPFLSVSVTASARSPGPNRWHSLTQLPTTLVGVTTRNGGRVGACSLVAQMSEIACSVLPRPMSSARIPPSLC